jgi:hypothetical protein
MQEQIKSLSTKDKSKKEVRYSVEEISNGWILCKNIEFSDSKGYHSETTKTYFKENPLDTSVLSKVNKMKQAIGQTDEDGDEIV